ncbi:MAG: diacylglycerol kinase [Magnetococcales bacterium]|nr:diacylglycerol kinase [Magnetococcales bacterium]
MSNPFGPDGFRHLLKATGYSLQGLAAAWRHETAFRQEALLTPLILPLAFWLGHGAVEQILLAVTWLLVPLAELVNSAVEAVVDRVGTEQHVLAGRAKDLGSAAVFVALTILALTWGRIGWEHLS